MMTRLALLASLLLPAFNPPAAAQAFPDQSFPNRPIRIIVPINPGGGTDVFARKLAELAAPVLGQPVIVENRPGGSGTIGVQQVVEARPDGQTLGFLWNTPVTAAPHTLGTRYGSGSFTSILSVGYSAYTLCAQPDFPAANLAEFIAAIRAKPGEYTWGNEGLGGAMHLGVERILRKLDLDMTTVPFQGAGQTLPAFLGRHITFYGGSVVGAMPAITAGTAKCLLLTTEEGHPGLPAASGLGSIGLADHAISIWWGLFAPNGIPPERLARLSTVFLAAARSEAFGRVAESQGATWRVQDGPAMAAQIAREYAALGEVARSLGLSKAP